MSTTNREKKPTDTVAVWDGTAFDFTQRQTAQQLVRAGTHQLAENVQARDLLTKEQIDAQAPADEPAPRKPGRPPKDAKAEKPKRKPGRPRKDAAGNYKTREMKAK